MNTTRRTSKPPIYRRAALNNQDGKGAAPLIGLFPLVALIILWQLIGHAHSAFFPRPSLWWKAVLVVERHGDLWGSLLATTETFIEAIVLATLIGTALGIAMGNVRWSGKALDPLLDFLRNVPAAALVPAAAIVLGTNAKMALIIVVFSSVWPILLNTRAEFQRISPVLISVVDNLGIRGMRRQSVLLGSVLPAVLLGIRVAAPLALIVTLLAEFITNIPGLGALLLSAQQNFDSAEVYGLLIVAGILALLVNSLVSLVEAPVVRRHGPTA